MECPQIDVLYSCARGMIFLPSSPELENIGNTMVGLCTIVNGFQGFVPHSTAHWDMSPTHYSSWLLRYTQPYLQHQRPVPPHFWLRRYRESISILTTWKNGNDPAVDTKTQKWVSGNQERAVLVYTLPYPGWWWQRVRSLLPFFRSHPWVQNKASQSSLQLLDLCGAGQRMRACSPVL